MKSSPLNLVELAFNAAKAGQSVLLHELLTHKRLALKKSLEEANIVMLRVYREKYPADFKEILFECYQKTLNQITEPLTEESLVYYNQLLSGDIASTKNKVLDDLSYRLNEITHFINSEGDIVEIDKGSIWQIKKEFSSLLDQIALYHSIELNLNTEVQNLRNDVDYKLTLASQGQSQIGKVFSNAIERYQDFMQTYNQWMYDLDAQITRQVSSDQLKEPPSSLLDNTEPLDIHVTRADKDTLLHEATRYNQISAVICLINLGANPSQSNDALETPMTLAGKQGKSSSVYRAISKYFKQLDLRNTAPNSPPLSSMEPYMAAVSDIKNQLDLYNTDKNSREAEVGIMATFKRLTENRTDFTAEEHTIMMQATSDAYVNQNPWIALDALKELISKRNMALKLKGLPSQNNIFELMYDHLKMLDIGHRERTSLLIKRDKEMMRLSHLAGKEEASADSDALRSRAMNAESALEIMTTQNLQIKEDYRDLKNKHTELEENCKKDKEITDEAIKDNVQNTNVLNKKIEDLTLLVSNLMKANPDLLTQFSEPNKKTVGFF